MHLLGVDEEAAAADIAHGELAIWVQGESGLLPGHPLGTTCQAQIHIHLRCIDGMRCRDMQSIVAGLYLVWC